MAISNIHNRMPKTGILFTDICLGDFFTRHDFVCQAVHVCMYVKQFTSLNRKLMWCEKIMFAYPTCKHNFYL